LPKQFIKVGSFGGFAGSLTQVFLFPDGSRIKTTDIPGVENDTTRMESISKKTVKKLLKAFKGDEAPIPVTGTPGNMNYFLEVHLKDTMLRYSWSDSQQPASPVLSTYQKTLAP
jgi:hypothetical protein